MLLVDNLGLMPYRRRIVVVSEYLILIWPSRKLISLFSWKANPCEAA